MGGTPSRRKEMVNEFEGIRQANIRQRLTVFDRASSAPNNSESHSRAERLKNNENSDINYNDSSRAESDRDDGDENGIKQMALTENNVRVISRPIVAGEDISNDIRGLDGPSYILDERMMRVLEFMLDPSFEKGQLTIRSLLTTSQRKSSLAFSKAVHGIEKVLVIVQSTLGHVFGAFIEDKFEDEKGGWRRGSEENFLFAMGNITKKPLKLLVSPERKYSYYSNSTNGFYAGQGKFELSAFSARYVCMKPVSFCVPAPSFDEVELEDGVLCGTPGMPYFEPRRMEAFAVIHYEDPNDPQVIKRRKEQKKNAEQKAIAKEKRRQQRRAEKKLKRKLQKKGAKAPASAQSERRDD